MAAHGSGTLEIRIFEKDWFETFDLELTVGEQAPQRFRSEPRVRNEPANEIISDVRPAELVCYGHVFQINAIHNGETSFRRGDCNADGSIDVSDPIHLLLHLFAGDREPPCTVACDANDDEKLDLADAVTLLTHLFAHGGDLPEPFGACGSDPTKGDLGCERYWLCEPVSVLKRQCAGTAGRNAVEPERSL